MLNDVIPKQTFGDGVDLSSGFRINLALMLNVLNYRFEEQAA